MWETLIIATLAVGFFIAVYDYYFDTVFIRIALAGVLSVVAAFWLGVPDSRASYVLMAAIAFCSLNLVTLLQCIMVWLKRVH